MEDEYLHLVQIKNANIQIFKIIALANIGNKLANVILHNSYVTCVLEKTNLLGF